MASFGLRSLVDGAKRLALGTTGQAPLPSLFRQTDPQIDGEECSHDCSTCHVNYPRGFKIDEDDTLYGFVKGWGTHVLVATGKTDWVRDVQDEKGSVMEAIGDAAAPRNGRLMLSASNMCPPHGTTDYSKPTTILLLPAFMVLENVTPRNVPTLISDFINIAPTTTSPLEPFRPPRESSPDKEAGTSPGLDATSRSKGSAPRMAISSRPCPHNVLILLCSQKTRDARCGQSAPLLRKELERHLRPLGLYRDLDDERPGGVGIYFISHVGGHKYSANMMVYRRPDPFGLDFVDRGKEGTDLKPRLRRQGRGSRSKKGESPAEKEQSERTDSEETKIEENGTLEVGEEEESDVGAAQCIWLARIRPEDCENIVRFTVLQGKVVKPERQLRGGFNRSKGLTSW